MTDTTLSHADLVERMGTIEREMQKLGAHEKMTRAQELQFQALQEEFADVNLARKRIERAKDLDQVRALASGANGGQLHSGSTGDEHEPRSLGSDVRDRAARVVDQHFRNGDLPDYAAERVTDLVKGSRPHERDLPARWAIATGDPDYLRAFAHIAADPTRGHLLWTEREKEAFQAVAHIQSEMRAMSLTDANGGYMVPLTLDPAIILTSAGSINPLRQISRVVQTTTDQWQGVNSAGVTAEWKTEASEAADAAPTLDDQPIPVHFGDAFVPYSFEVGMDAVNFLPELQKLLVDAADQLQATAYTTGTGTGQPKGIITALTGTASEINAAADDTFAKGDIYTIQNALPPRFQPNAQWCASLPIINTMSQFETTAGARLFPELSEGRLLNRPINELSNMDSTITTAGAVSNFVLLYGAFENFVIVDRIGTTLEFIPNLVGANRRPTGQRGALLWFRTGSDTPNINAFRMLDVASAA